jgi:hypothetical protein
MLKLAARVLGAVFVTVAVLGFVPGVTSEDGMLLGIFHVNTFHNIIHLASGVIALAMSGTQAMARLYFRVFSIVYGLVAVLGLFAGDHDLLGMAHNYADMGLHVVIASAALYLGFVYRDKNENSQSSAAPKK